MKSVRVGDIAEVFNGYAFDSESFNSEGKGLPIIRIRDIVPGYSATFYSGEYPKAYLIDNGALLIGMDGEFNIEFWKGGKALLNQRVCQIIPNDSVVDILFLKYRLTTLLKRIEDETPFVTVKHLSSEKLKDEVIDLPPLTEQKRIASLLKRADRLRQLRRTANDLRDSLLESVFLEMFGEYQKPNCPFTPLEELVKITGGGTPSRDVPEYFEGNIPWLTSKDMQGEYIYDTQEHITEKAIQESATNLVPVGSILLVVKSKILMHRLPVAITKVPLCHGQDIKSIQCSKKVNPFFLVYVLRHNEKHLLFQARGANTEGLTLPMLNEIKVPNVPLSLQEEFASMARRVDALRERISEAERQVEGLFESLLEQAFNQNQEE